MTTSRAVRRSMIRDRLEKTRRNWTGPENRAAAGALADEVMKLLDELGISTINDDWQT